MAVTVRFARRFSMRRRFLLVLVMLFMTIPVTAKGPADRIIVTGPTIDGELILTRPETLYLLSFAMLEDLSVGPVDEPVNPGEIFYELERQFQANENDYQTFDRARFYPDSGYVFYMGMENGSSEYDNKWFRTRPDGRDAMTTMLNASAQPVLVLMHGNMIRFADPSTLKELAVLEMPDQPAQVQDFVDGPDASTFDITDVDLDGAAIDYRVDLVSRTLCPVSEKRIAAAEAVGIPWMVADAILQQKRLFKDANFKWVDALSAGHAFLYQPDSPTVEEVAPGGILVTSLANGDQLDHWLPDRTFSMVIAGGENFYALEVLADETHLLQLNPLDGGVLGTTTLMGDTWSLGYGVFDLSAFDESVVELSTCPA
jgi:hypothetical protein